MQRVFLSVLSGVFAAWALSGCATILDQSTQHIEIYTPGVEQADCSLDTPKHRYKILTPGKTRVEKENYDMIITCEKIGYETAIRAISPTVSPSTFWNVFNGLIPGTTYDVASGAIVKFPSVLEIQMVPVAPKDVIFEPMEEEKNSPVKEKTSAVEEELAAPPAGEKEKADEGYAAPKADKAFDAGKK